MSKKKTELHTFKKPQERQDRLLSFVGGLVFFTAVMAVVVYKDEGVRQELGAQAKSLLKTSKDAVQQLRFVVGKMGKLIRGTAMDRTESPIEGGAENPAQYDSDWAAYQSQNPEHVKNHLSG